MEPLPGLGCKAERQRVEVGLIGRGIVKTRMRPAAVVEVEIAADRSAGRWRCRSCWRSLSLIEFDALSQHLPGWPARRCAGRMLDCAAAMEMPPASNAAAESTVSLPSFMMKSFSLLGVFATLPTGANAGARGMFRIELLLPEKNTAQKHFAPRHQQPRQICNLASGSRSRFSCANSAASLGIFLGTSEPFG